MDRDTAVARIQEKLGFRSDLVSNIQSALQDAQDELERGQTLPWFLINYNSQLVLTPLSPPSAAPLKVNLPSDFIKEIDDRDGNLRYQAAVPGPQIYLRKLDYREAEEGFYGRRWGHYDQNVEIITSEDTTFTAGTPLAYVLKETSLAIYPGPDQPYTLLWSYYQHDTALNGPNVTNRWLTNAPWLLIGRAGMLISASTRDSDAMAIFQAIVYGDPTKGIRGAEKDFLASIYEREIAGRNYRLGGKL